LLTDPAQSRTDHPRIAGLLLAAGAGVRYGQPKALVDTGSGLWVQRGIAALANCDPVLVVLGASSDKVAELLPPNVGIVLNPDFSEGMGSSLRAGLIALGEGNSVGWSTPGGGEMTPGTASRDNVEAALVMLVDLPGIGPAVINRVLSAVGSAPDARSCLARAAFDGIPGHPVLLGSDHWPGVIKKAVGDRGARDYLKGSLVRLVECADIGSGEDVDLPG
jgi:CTP:molybdopterin cytidylyltransferase MocA